MKSELFKVTSISLALAIFVLSQNGSCSSAIPSDTCVGRATIVRMARDVQNGDREGLKGFTKAAALGKQMIVRFHEFSPTGMSWLVSGGTTPVLAKSKLDPSFRAGSNVVLQCDPRQTTKKGMFYAVKVTAD